MRVYAVHAYLIKTNSFKFCHLPKSTSPRAVVYHLVSLVTFAYTYFIVFFVLFIYISVGWVCQQTHDACNDRTVTMTMKPNDTIRRSVFFMSRCLNLYAQYRLINDRCMFEHKIRKTRRKKNSVFEWKAILHFFYYDSWSEYCWWTVLYI